MHAAGVTLIRRRVLDGPHLIYKDVHHSPWRQFRNRRVIPPITRTLRTPIPGLIYVRRDTVSFRVSVSDAEQRKK